MTREQIEIWPEEVSKGYRLNKHLLAAGERPDTRPWGGIFERNPCEPVAVVCPLCGAGIASWCADDGKPRIWRYGSLVHHERVAVAWF
jgi:hypothetical protein